jgi:class 3 adenylate cyclase
MSWHVMIPIHRIASLPGLSDHQMLMTATNDELDQQFLNDPSLIGVVIFDTSGKCKGMISRYSFYELLSRPFAREIFIRLPIQEMLNRLDDPYLKCREDDDIFNVGTKYIEGYSTYVSRCILVEDNHSYKVLSADVLLINFSKLQQELREASLRYQDHIVEQSKLFEKFVPKFFIDHRKKLFSDGDIMIGMLDDEKYVTVMFIDIRGFTKFSEKVDPAECFNFLNSYFSKVDPIIQRNGGIIYQFLGDGILAMFPEENGENDDSLPSAQRAMVTVGEFHCFLEEYNLGRQRAGYEPMKVGIGLHCGLVAIGVTGSSDRYDAAAFGHTINFASRLEGKTKDLDQQVIISEDVYYSIPDQLKAQCHHLGEHEIRGMEDKVMIYGYRSSESCLGQSGPWQDCKPRSAV